MATKWYNDSRQLSPCIEAIRRKLQHHRNEPAFPDVVNKTRLSESGKNVYDLREIWSETKYKLWKMI